MNRFPAKLVAGSLLVVGAFHLSASAPSDGVVATVGDQPIRLSQIQMPPDSLKVKYKLLYGKYPQLPADSARLDALTLQTEKELLTGKIRSLVREAAIRRFGITVSEEELLATRRRQLSKVRPEEILAKQRETAAALLQALEGVRTGRVTEAEAYETHLSKLMTPEEWLVHRQYYHTPKRIALLEQLDDMTLDELMKPDAGTRALVLDEKLNQKIDESIARQDPVFAEYAQARALNNLSRMREIDKDDPAYLSGKRAEWWRQEYARAGIRILDKRFQDVFAQITRPKPARK